MAALGLGNLSDTQEKAIVALLSEPTIGQAAKAAGVGERTLHRWLTDPIFIRAWSEARRRAFAQAVSLAQRYSPLAIDTLARISNNPNALDADRIKASIGLLRFGRESIELDDLLARMNLLESQIAGNARPMIDVQARETPRHVAEDLEQDDAELPAPDPEPRRGGDHPPASSQVQALPPVPAPDPKPKRRRLGRVVTKPITGKRSRRRGGSR